MRQGRLIFRCERDDSFENTPFHRFCFRKWFRIHIHSSRSCSGSVCACVHRRKYRKKVGLRNTHEKIQLSIPCPLRSCLPFTGETCITHDYIHDEFCLSHFAYWRSVGWSVLELTTVCFVVGPPRIKYIRSRRHTGPRRRRRWRFPFSFFTRSRSFADVVQRIIPISTYCTTECVCVFLCAPPLCRCCWQRGCEASSE